jgi:hypothetical protein
LAEDRADGCFEAVPTAGGPQAWALRNQGSEHGITGEMVVDGFDVGSEVEEAADASDDGGQEADVWEEDVDGEALARREMGHFNAAGDFVDLGGAEIAVVYDDFDTCDGAGSEEAEDGVPVVGRAVAKAKGDVLLFVPCGAFATEGAGWAMKEVEKCFVESAEAAEAGRHGDFGHWHPGFVDELFCEEHAAGLGDGDGGCSKVLEEEAAELPFAEAESFGEPFDRVAFAIESAFRDESEGA